MFLEDGCTLLLVLDSSGPSGVGGAALSCSPGSPQLELASAHVHKFIIRISRQLRGCSGYNGDQVHFPLHVSLGGVCSVWV